MKYGLIAGCALVSAMTAFADMDDLRVSFETKGVDTYQDGKTVLDGEFYALVWPARLGSVDEITRTVASVEEAALVSLTDALASVPST